jgi:hypothetical protein
MELPNSKRQPTRKNPKIMVMYGLPKVGKTEALSKLDDCLIIDMEKGTASHEALAIDVSNISELKQLGATLMKYKNENDGQNRYKRLAFDTADVLEEWCETSAVDVYKNTAIGRSFIGKSILELPNGAGYGHHREEMKKWILAFSALCDTLIIVTHVKDKLLATKAGNEVSTKDINLVGKLATIVCSMSDAIGYLYREDGELMISFEGGDNVNAGARQEHLRGMNEQLDWNRIFID